MEQTHSPRLLGSKIPPNVREIPAHLPHNPHRLFNTLRPPIPLRAQYLLQHAPASPHATSPWTAIPARREEGEKTCICLDRQQGRHDEMVHQRESRRSCYRRPEEILGSVRCMGGWETGDSFIVEGLRLHSLD